MKKRALSLLVSFSLVVACLYGAFVPANVSAESGGRDYVIFDAEPSSVSSEDMASAKPVWASDTDGHFWAFGYKAAGTAVVRTDGDTPYYLCTFEGTGEKNGAVIETGFAYNGGGGNQGWVSHRSVLEALAPYITVSYDVRIIGGGQTVTLSLYPVPEWSGDAPSQAYGVFDSFTAAASGEWVSRKASAVSILSSGNGNPHWSCADLLAGIETDYNGTVTAEMRGFKLSLSEKDRDEINRVLGSVECIDNLSWFTGDYSGAARNNLPKRPDGGTDYFKMLTAYDKYSRYTTNIHSVSGGGAYEGGSVSLSHTEAYENTAVTVTAVPEDGFERVSLSVTDTLGNYVTTVQTGTDSFLLTLPADDVTVTAEFEAAEILNGKSYVIWEADPARVSAEDGASAKPKWASDTDGHFWAFGYKATGTGVIRTDEEVPYYSCNLTEQGGKGGAILENGLNYFDSAGYLGWMSYRSVIDALKQYIVVSYEIRVNGLPEAAEIRIGPVPEWSTGDPYEVYGEFDSVSISDTAEWQAISEYGAAVIRQSENESGDPHWSCGDLSVSVQGGAIGEAPVTVDLRRFRLELRESDRAAVNAALSSVEGIDSLKWFTGNWEGTPQNNLPKDENGNTDYFQMLVKYDAAAAYAEGYPLIKSKDSSPHGELYAPENAKPGETVVVAAVPHIGYNSAGVSAVSAEGGEISVSETDGGWSFVMPEASVTLTAEFVSEASEAESRLTVWEALPESISVNDGASASVAWGGGNEFITSLTGTAAVKTDEIIPYYRASIASSDISAGAAFGGSEELAGSILGDPALFAAVAPYLHIEGETRIEPGPNMTLKPAVRLYPLSTSTSGAPGWEIGAFTYFDEWKSGYELCRWVGFDIKGVSLSSNKNKLFWNGDLYLQISYDASDITSPADQSSEKPVPSEPSFTENFDDHTDGWVYSSESSAGTVADGKLTFSVEEEGPQKFCLYTERFRQAYGCFSAAMKMPEIGTANASFFMTGEKFNENPYVPYNSFGEIDVVEYYSTWGENWAGTVHWYLWNPDMYRSSGDEELYGNNIRNGYHTYSVVWTEDAIYWYYDYELRRIYDGPGVTSGSGPMKLLLQLRPDYEDGWGGEYDPSAYPYEMCVDWVNAWSIVS